MVRNYNPDLIEIRNNPFSSTRSVAIADGIFMKDLANINWIYIPSTDNYLEIGILEILLKKIQEIEEGKTPQHVFILGAYGQGKSFSLKRVQDKIYSEFNGAIISYSIGGNSNALLDDINIFQNKIMEDLEELFDKLDDSLYTNKTEIDERYALTTGPKNFNQTLLAYDNAFRDLQILVYIFLDELDKIIISEASNEQITSFLEHLKLISDNCNNSISLIVAGTPNCLVKMNETSVDYIQRFEKIQINYLTKEKTIEYINKKCSLKLSYFGYHPLDSSVKSKIYNLSGGNIRRIEALCRELWNYSARKKVKLTLPSFEAYLTDYLYEPIKNLIPNRFNDNIIKFIIKLYIKGSRGGIIFFKRGLSLAKKREIEEFTSTPTYIRVVNKSYVLDEEFKSQVDNIIN